MLLTIFIVAPIRSSPGMDNWNPMADLNSDGKVDIFDAILFATAYGSSGDPINWSQIALPGFMNKPAYDSGWQHIDPGLSLKLYHNLNTTDLLVYMEGQDNSSATFINQVNYGTLAFWGNLTSNSIIVYRGLNETWFWNEFRILIWKLP